MRLRGCAVEQVYKLGNKFILITFLMWGGRENMSENKEKQAIVS